MNGWVDGKAACSLLVAEEAAPGRPRGGPKGYLLSAVATMVQVFNQKVFLETLPPGDGGRRGLAAPSLYRRSETRPVCL